MKKFGWAYLGCGNIANTTAKELVKFESNRIVAAWDIDKEKAKAFAAKYGGKAYDTAEEAMDAPEVEGVYIALPANLHKEYSLLCVKKKKATLCEKPLSVNEADAREMIETARREGVYLSEAMWTWHNKTAQTVRKWIADGKIGKVKEVNCCYAFPMLQFSGNNSLLNLKQAKGAMMELGVYAVRYCVELFGIPKRVECNGRLKCAADLGEKVEMYYPDFTAHLTLAVDQKVGENVEIIGTDGKITVPSFHMAKKAVLSGKYQEEFKDTVGGLYDHEFENVAKEIRSGLTESQIISSENSIQTLKIMDECRKQMGVIFPMEIKEEEIKDMKIQSFSHLGFNCKDIEKTMQFYCDIMGCKKKFVLTYGDVADNIAEECKREGKKEPAYLGAMRKRMGNQLWNVYLEWIPGTFIELFYVPNAKKKRIPGPKDLNYTHYSLAVENLEAYRKMIIAKGGADYIDSEISKGLDNTYQMWMHDPDGNKFEIMEYTKESLQFKES